MTTITPTEAPPVDSLQIPSTTPVRKQAALEGKDCGAGKAYAKRSTGNRFVTKLTVDPITNLALIEIQYMDELQPEGRQLTRATIIRRALRLYTRQLLRAKKDGMTQILELERAELLKLVTGHKAN